jgi:hypothetical protein
MERSYFPTTLDPNHPTTPPTYPTKWWTTRRQQRWKHETSTKQRIQRWTTRTKRISKPRINARTNAISYAIRTNDARTTRTNATNTTITNGPNATTNAISPNDGTNGTSR